MCEDLEKEYGELMLEYQQKVTDKMPPEELQEYNEVLFSAHSCGIEGNSYTINDTRALKELSLGVVPQGKPLVETMEMLDHFHAFEFMTQTRHEPLTEDYLLQLHKILTEHTIAYRHPGAKPGEYTTMDMAAGDTLFGDHEELIAKVPLLLEKTEQAMQGNLPRMFVAATFHGYFIYLHPFRDGNGRMGRLLSNKILLQSGHPIVIIPREEKEEYISALKLFHSDSIEYLVAFFYKTAIRRMQNELKQKSSNSAKGMFFLF
ncbi:MAG: Fic family protein [Bacteroidaceae bacterium]|nr:Fic family protein [Bacteroidaceae bacterium]